MNDTHISLGLLIAAAGLDTAEARVQPNGIIAVHLPAHGHLSLQGGGGIVDSPTEWAAALRRLADRAEQAAALAEPGHRVTVAAEATSVEEVQS